MKQTIIILLIAFGMKAQESKTDVLHVYSSWAGTTLIGTSINHYLDRPTLSTWLGGVTMFGIGLGKEYIWDKKMKRGTFNKNDIVLNSWGCALGLVTCRVVIDIKQRNNNEDKRKYTWN